MSCWLIFESANCVLQLQKYIKDIKCACWDRIKGKPLLKLFVFADGVDMLMWP